MNQDQKKWNRVNRQIRISPVMVILDDENLGVMATERALNLAMQRGLDLVEVAPQVRPPVCKIIDYGKFKYEQGLKEKKARQLTKSQQMKEIRLRPSIALNDLEVKINSAKKFLESGNKVQIKIKFQKRENVHKELGMVLINKVLGCLEEFGKPVKQPQAEGKFIVCVIDPKK